MDPNATLINILNDLREARNPNYTKTRRDEHKLAAAEALHDLGFWLQKGGFVPDVVGLALSTLSPVEEENNLRLRVLKFSDNS